MYFMTEFQSRAWDDAWAALEGDEVRMNKEVNNTATRSVAVLRLAQQHRSSA